MTIILPAVAFAAFCVWLAVRIVDRRERWAKRTAIALILWMLVAYPLSMGPIWRLRSKGALPKWADIASEVAHEPFIWLMDNSPLANDVGASYFELWVEADDANPAPDP